MEGTDRPPIFLPFNCASPTILSSLRGRKRVYNAHWKRVVCSSTRCAVSPFLFVSAAWRVHSLSRFVSVTFGLSIKSCVSCFLVRFIRDSSLTLCRLQTTLPRTRITALTLEVMLSFQFHIQSRTQFFIRTKFVCL